jgi:outer membrane receptor protein involved in Fe transport
MVYATWSRGYRPGGINRRGTVPPYEPDYLTNYELGVKTAMIGGKLRLNAAVYQQDWQHFQFSFLGENSFTEIHNGPNARVRGFEMDASYSSGPLSLGAALAFTDAKTRQNLCDFDDPTYTCTGPDNGVAAPIGTRLPVTPQFKISGNARYTVPVGSAKAYGQIVVSHQSGASQDINAADAAAIGYLPEFTAVDLALGATLEDYTFELFASNLFDERGQLTRYVQCGSCYQRPYIVPTTPRTIGIRVGTKF